MLNRTKLLGAITLTVLTYALWVTFKPATAPSGNEPAVLAKVSPTVSKLDTVVIKAKVKAYKPSVKVTLKLPAEVLIDETKAVTAVAIVSSSEKRTEVSTVLDTETGESVTYVHLVPDPWFATESRGNASLAYGIKLPSNTWVGRVSVHEDVLQIKNLHFGVNATVDTDGDAFAGAGVSYRW